jgi:hypothetical protein
MVEPPVWAERETVRTISIRLLILLVK